MKLERQCPLLASVALTLVASTWFAACGGGGGGGGGTSGGDLGSDSRFGVRVLHGAVDGAPVDVVSSTGSTVASQVFFADSKGYRSIPTGSQLISLTRALNPANTIASFEVDSSGRDRFSLLLSGDNTTFGIRARLIEDAVPSNVAGSLVRFVNGVTRAASLAFSVGTEVSSQVAFSDNSDYIQVTPGTARILAIRSADGQTVASVEHTFVAGKAYTVFVAGEVGYYTKSRVFTDN
jgi:hypothetical protein